MTHVRVLVEVDGQQAVIADSKNEDEVHIHQQVDVSKLPNGIIKSSDDRITLILCRPEGPLDANMVRNLLTDLTGSLAQAQGESLHESS